jgi:hypothetical protein
MEGGSGGVGRQPLRVEERAAVITKDGGHLINGAPACNVAPDPAA